MSLPNIKRPRVESKEFQKDEPIQNMRAGIVSAGGYFKVAEGHFYNK